MTTRDARRPHVVQRVPVRARAEPLVDVGQLLDAKVRVTAGAERAGLVHDVPSDHANRILAVLGAPAAAA